MKNLAPMALTCVLTLSAIGQVGLVRTTMSGVPGYPGGAADPSHSVVVMTAGPNRVVFDPLYGGALRFWTRGGGTSITYPATWNESVVYPNIGAMMQVVYDTGQDSTQGGAGFRPFPIATLGGAQVATTNYYARETVFSPGPTPYAEYEVRGFAPLWFLPEDFRAFTAPPVSALRWAWGGNNAGIPLDELRFSPQAANQDGIIGIANQYATAGAWNTRLLSIDEGRSAARVYLDLSRGGPLSFGGILFRKTVTSGANSVGNMLGAPGYAILANNLGQVDVHEYPPPPGSANTVIHSVANAFVPGGPVRLEYRTNNCCPGLLEIFVNDVLLWSTTDPSPQLGTATGFYAFSDNGQPILFKDPQVFDVGVEFRANYKAYPAGFIEADIEVRNAPGVSAPHDFYPQGAPGLQWNPDLGSFASPSTLRPAAEVRDSCGLLLAQPLSAVSCQPTSTSSSQNPISQGIYARVINAPTDAFEHRIWSPSSGDSIYAYAMSAFVDGSPAGAPHSSTIPIGSNLAGIAFSPLDLQSCAGGPQATLSHRFVSRWSVDPLPLPGPPASWSLYGTGGSAGSGVPTIALAGPPRVGSTATVSVTGPASADGFLMAGLGSATSITAGTQQTFDSFFGFPVPLSGLTGPFHVDASVLIPFALNPTGSWSLPVPLNSCAILGASIYLQALVVDPVANQAPFVGTSPGLLANIGL